jgi:hypothetical protein
MIFLEEIVKAELQIKEITLLLSIPFYVMACIKNARIGNERNISKKHVLLISFLLTPVSGLVYINSKSLI